MNFSLFKATTRSNWLIGAIFFAVMFMYLTIIISMFDPNSMDALNSMLQTLPKELVSAMGFDNVGTNLTSFIASYYYGFIVIMFPMIYCIIVANRLVAKHVDSGSMAYLLSTPNSRLKIVTTQALYLVSSLVLLFALVTVSGIGVSEALFAGQLDVGGFMLLNFTTLLAFMAISSICFFFSCIFNDTKYSLAFGSGIPIGFFVINMLANVSEQTSWLGSLSLFSLLKPTEILAGDSFTVVACVIFAVVAVALYVGGIVIFNRRSLPL